MTCAELYACDPTFAAGVNSWVANRRCPFGLGDHLAGLDMPDAAACAWWAEAKPDRKVFMPVAPGEEGGPFPLHLLYGGVPPGGGRWMWNARLDDYAHDAKGAAFAPGTYFPTALAAILALLDNPKAPA